MIRGRRDLGIDGIAWQLFLFGGRLKVLTLPLYCSNSGRFGRNMIPSKHSTTASTSDL